jgi:hypothetical protein
VHRLGTPVHPFRVVERDEVVDHRRAEPAALRREPPVAEVEDVQSARELLDGRSLHAAPDGPQGVRPHRDRQPPLQLDPVQRRLDLPPPARAREREGDELVLPGRRFRDPGERAAHVVADARPLVGERGDVHDDPHGAR